MYKDQRFAYLIETTGMFH